LVLKTQLVDQTSDVLVTVMQYDVRTHLQSGFIHCLAVPVLVVCYLRELVFKFYQVLRVYYLVLLQLHGYFSQVKFTAISWPVVHPNARSCKSFFAQSNTLYQSTRQIIFEQLRMLGVVDLVALA
jgi:hypothetical protein